MPPLSAWSQYDIHRIHRLYCIDDASVTSVEARNAYAFDTTYSITYKVTNGCTNTFTINSKAFNITFTKTNNITNYSAFTSTVENTDNNATITKPYC